MSGPNLYGVDLFGDAIVPPSRGKLADSFLVPPFSVLNAREGWWQERKRAWIGHGIKSEIGRGVGAGGLSDGIDDPARTVGSGRPGSLRTEYEKKDGANWASSTGNRGQAFRLHLDEGETTQNGTSIFDPVLCELAYRWWCPEGGQIIDPFAGGSVRGVVASLLGRRYWGCDLRPEQVEANREQASSICPDVPPDWVCGDAAGAVPSAPSADFIFSCPPYGDLERYSDDPRDLSTMDYPAFVAALGRIVAACCARLKPNRFACFVVGDFRDKRGNYRNFVGDTVAAFRSAGLHLYNEAILVTVAGSLPVRVGSQWAASRKLGKTHQNVLLFVKGDGKSAATAAAYTEAAP